MPNSADCPSCRSPLGGAPDRACPVCSSRAREPERTADYTAEHVSAADTATGDEPEIPGYRVVSTLGQGGMGVVYQARQLALDRVVALKVIRNGASVGAEQRERFEAEGRALARLTHPHIVQVFEVGESAGTPFITLEYLAGGSLSGYLKARGPFAPVAAARLVQALADAMECAHVAGILHRDLKPANVLLAGDTEADLQPKITDFGLAKWLDRADGPTVSGAVMGTPSYMAPEQAAGQLERIGAATDVYALGATLYELLLGRPPFRAESSVATLALVMRAEPTAPRTVRADVPAELEAICLKCLEKAPDKRYASAADLRDDLGRFLRGESTVARPLTRAQRVWRAVRKRRAAVFATVAAVALAVSAAGVTWAVRPEPQTPVDPDLPLRELETQLAEGRPVELVGDGGLPRWWRWAHRPATLGESVGDVKPVASFQTGDVSLLELMQNPPATGYRFSADLRQDRLLDANTAGANVGLYWQYRPEQFANGTAARRFYSLEFNEVWGAFEAPEERAKRPLMLKDGKPHGHSAKCFDRASATVPGKGDTRGEEASLCSFPFIPNTKFPGPWRAVRIEVRPDRARVEWANEKGEYLPVSTITAATVARTAPLVERGIPGVRLSADPRPLSAPLGILASRSMVSFRNVRIEPLNP